MIQVGIRPNVFSPSRMVQPWDTSPGSWRSSALEAANTLPEKAEDALSEGWQQICTDGELEGSGRAPSPPGQCQADIMHSKKIYSVNTDTAPRSAELSYNQRAKSNEISSQNFSSPRWSHSPSSPPQTSLSNRSQPSHPGRAEPGHRPWWPRGGTNGAEVGNAVGQDW